MSGWPFPSLGPGHTFRSRPVCGPYARETARMRTGLRQQSAARVVQVRRARYYLLPTFVARSALPPVSLQRCPASRCHGSFNVTLCPASHKKQFF